MSKIRRVKLCILLIICFTALNLSGCGNEKKIVLTTGFQESELFRIDDRSCYANELLVYLVNTENQYINLYGNEFFGVSINGINVKQNISEEVLSRITRVKIMNLMAGNYHVDLDDSDLEIINKAANEYYSKLSVDEKYLFNISSAEDVASLYREYRLAEKVYEYIVKDINPEISDDEARTMVVKEIFISTDLSDEDSDSAMNTAQKILGKLEEGEDFDSLAAIYSDKEQVNCSYTKMTIDQDILEEAFELSKGEISEPLVSKNGIYILLCVDPFNRDETDTTKETIIRDRKLKAFETAYEKYASDSKSYRRYYFNEEVWKEVMELDLSKTSTKDFFEIYYSYFK